MIGSHPSATSAVAATALPMSDAHQIGTASRTGRLISFSGLPRPVPSPSGSGMSIVCPWKSMTSRRTTRRTTSIVSLMRMSGFS